jgi:hypothetical protein
LTSRRGGGGAPRGRRRAADILARDLAVLPRDGNHAAAVEALDVRPRQREVDRIDVHARHQLGFVDRLLDRLDCSFEVHDDATPNAARLGHAEADDVETLALKDLSYDGGHL